MELSKALLKILNNDDEPLNKRIKIADNAFKSSEFRMKHKEAILLKWVIKRLGSLSDKDAWLLTNKWLSSEQFKNLTTNDISNDDINVIVEIFLNQLQGNNHSNATFTRNLIDGVLLLSNNKVFQLYFKYNLELYCRLLSVTLERIDSSLHFKDFLKSSFLFLKGYLSEETFYKHFLHILFPVLVRKAFEFKSNQNVFEEVSRVFQKCMFSGNAKKFESFFTKCFENSTTEEDLALPKAVFKYLLSTYSENTELIALTFRIIFHAFYQSFQDFSLTYKFFILIVQMIQIDVKNDFNISWQFKVKQTISLTNALNVLLEVLDVLSTISFTESEVSNISFTDFLRNILKSFVNWRVRSSITYEIILRCISINPMVIEPIVTYILLYVMAANNDKFKQVYEKVVIAVFEVFSKLHRTENFISKMIPALKSILVASSKEESLTEVYQFTGKNDIKVTTDTNVPVNSIFTENIMQCFTKCINGLASWQVINVFQTLLFHLNEAVNTFSNLNNQDLKELTFLEILERLTDRLLRSVRIADHNIPQNVVDKLVKGLEQLKDVLKVFGLAILKREHNHITMRTFLNLSYVWGETYMILTYYSVNNEVKMATVIDNTYTACNLRYLHSYLDVKQWQLVSQRITNFGEQPCKKILQKLYVQKLRAMLLFEEQFNNDIIANVVKALQTDPKDTWEDLLLDKFAVNFVLPKMDKVSLIFLAEHLIENETLHEIHHIRDSVTLINAITYVVVSKINKLFKHKRKHDQDLKKNMSMKMFVLIPDKIFFSSEDYDMGEIFEEAKKLFSQEDIMQSSVESKEEKLLEYLKVLKKFPCIYSSENIQKVMLLYLFSLYGDILHCSKKVKEQLEELTIGILQTSKFKLTDIFNIDTLGSKVLNNFERYNVVFSLITDNMFKNEECIKHFESMVNLLIKKLEDPKYLSSSLLVLQAVNKIKKSKMDSSSKEAANQYKDKILNKVAKLVCKSDYLIEAYATCLKHYLASETDSESLKKLLDKLTAYIQYSLENISNENKKGCVILFTTLLHNKQKIKHVEDDLVLKIWNACKKVEIGEEYSHLVNLIVTLIPNDEFHLMVCDLLSFTETSICDKNYTLLARQLKTWESLLTCDVNPVKMKVWQEVLEKLIQNLLNILSNDKYDETLFKNIVHLEENIIQAQRFILSPPLIDMFILNVINLMNHEKQDFETMFNLSISILEKLLKYRNAMIMDRLPAFLQQYRIVLNHICARSNSDKKEDSLDINKASDCAHKLEKLTKNLVSCKKDMGRIAVFLIADILERYEQINLYTNVKLHLNNCVYSLISICDHHAVSYLKRVLSSASTEMFKILYEHYKKYYMFTGKV